MALQFKSEEEAREWLRNIKKAGEKPATESISLDDFVAEPKPESRGSVPPKPMPAEPPAAPELDEEPSGRRKSDLPKIDTSELPPPPERRKPRADIQGRLNWTVIWLAILGCAIYQLYTTYTGATVITGETHFAAWAAALLWGMLGVLFGYLAAWILSPLFGMIIRLARR